MSGDCLAFLRRLIQTPSLPGEEERVARLVAEEMRSLGYDQVWVDDAGNVIGRIRGRGEAPALLFNTHLDHVDPGPEEAWERPPYGAEEHAGCVWGRGAVDIKGPLAAQVYGAAVLAGEDARPAGDVYVTAVVQEEVGGLGARHLITHLQPPLVVVGEPSRNELRRGHRGRVELVVHAIGRSAHASAPERGANPLYALARLLTALESLEMRADPELGRSSVAPTLLRTDQRSRNVIPGEAWLTLDWRSVPGESAEEARCAVEELAARIGLPLRRSDARMRAEGPAEPASPEDGPETGQGERAPAHGDTARIEVEVPSYPRTSYTGLAADLPAENPPYLLPADDPALRTAAAVLESVLGGPPPVGTWTFATDGGHFARAGFTAIGFGPGDEALAHTVQERIPVAELRMAVAANAALAREWPARYARILAAEP